MPCLQQCGSLRELGSELRTDVTAILRLSEEECHVESSETLSDRRNKRREVPKLTS